MKRKLATAIVMVIMLMILNPTPGRSAEPIKMLCLESISGVMKDIGDRYQLGVKFAVEEINAKGGLLGRPIKVFYDDNQVKADVTLRKAERYILEEKVEFIMTGGGTHVGKSMGQAAEKYKVISLNYGSGGDDITGKDFTRYQFRACLSCGQQFGTMGVYFASTPYKKYYIICQDYAFGYDAANAFKKVMNRLKPDWQLVGEDYHPIGAKDLAPYISKIIASGAEVVITANWGSDLQVLLKQGASLGLKSKVASHSLADPVALSAIGDAAIGHIVVEVYVMTEETPQNQAFIERWKKRNMDPENPYPAWLIGKSYQAFMFMAEAIKKAKSTKPEDVIKAWEGMSYDALVGRMVMRPCDHQVVSPVSIAEVLPGPGRYYKFPFVGKPTVIPGEKAAVPPGETGNPRCK